MPSAPPTMRPISGASTPTLSEIRAPKTRRESRSRPSRSVPSQCAALGGIRRSSMSMSVGLGSGSRSAIAAATTIAAIQPIASQNNSPNFDNRAKISAAVAPLISALTRMTDPGVKHGVEHIDQESDEHKSRRHEQHHALQDHKIARVDGPDQEPADAR